MRNIYRVTMHVSNVLCSLLNTESDEKDGSCHDEGSKLALFSFKH